MTLIGKKVLIISNRPGPGGVEVMLKFVIDCLKQAGCDISLAFYQPYSISPNLSVPFHKLLFKRPEKQLEAFFGLPSTGVGCLLPEIEVMHFYSSTQWRELIDAHDFHIAVGGSCFPALGLYQHKVPFLAWVASDWLGDRQHRVQNLSLPRRLIDRLLVNPIARRLEKRIIQTGNLVALSQPTLLALNEVSRAQDVQEILSMPVDTNLFCPAPKHQTHRLSTNRRVGFVGRFEDPRKNIKMLFDVIAQLGKQFSDIELLLVGDKLSKTSLEFLRARGLEHRVTVVPYIDAAQLPEYLTSMDVFILPSHQEGLCISAMEAMSCAVPVVSTRCGGPESYIVDGENGILCEHNANDICVAVATLLSDDERRMRYASAARKAIIEQFSLVTQKTRFLRLLSNKFAS